MSKKRHLDDGHGRPACNSADVHPNRLVKRKGDADCAYCQQGIRQGDPGTGPRVSGGVNGPFKPGMWPPIAATAQAPTPAIAASIDRLTTVLAMAFANMAHDSADSKTLPFKSEDFARLVSVDVEAAS